MKKITRREFLKLSTVASTGLALTACGGKKPGSSADIVLQNGRIITVDPKDSIKNAVAMTDGLIDLVGSDDDVQAYIGPDTTLIDLGGKTVTPGLVDSHIHVVQYGKQTWGGFTDTRFPNVTTKDDLLRVVKEAVAQAEDGDWISGNQGFMLSFGISRK